MPIENYFLHISIKNSDICNQMLLKILKWIVTLIVLFLLSSVLLVVLYKYINPPATPLMLIRVFEGVFEGKSVGIEKDWVPFSEISPNVFRAFMTAEDRKFLKHKGFDWDAIDRARRYNERLAGKKLRGASTISMQTAKNAFLWQGHGNSTLRHL